MMAALFMWTQIFAALDPAGPLRDLQRVQERAFDLRTGDGWLSFQPASPMKYRYQSYVTRYLWDPTTGSYIKVYARFPALYSDATVLNDGRGLDIYSEPDEPTPF